jgi:hypothetical protein
MKKIIFVLLVVVISNTLYAQGFEFGVKGGADMHKLDAAGFKSNFSFGYHVGVMAAIKLSKKISLQPEAYLSQVDVDTASDFRTVYSTSIDSLRDIRLGYINIPLLLNYKLSKALALQAGPQFGILVTNEGLVQSGKSALKKGDFSMVGGLQLNISSFAIYARYVVGLSNVREVDVATISAAVDQKNWKNETIHLGVALKF